MIKKILVSKKHYLKLLALSFAYMLLINTAFANVESPIYSNTNMFNKQKAFLFVSLGMPTIALRQYVIQSNQYHIPLILRGLLDNNYPETAKRVFNILHPKNTVGFDSTSAISGGFEIDPLYFRQFHIQTVPALVIEANHHYSVIYGNIPIQKLLSLMAEKTTITSIKNAAKNYLDQAKRGNGENEKNLGNANG